jgi:hypothetical protein
MVGKKCIDEVKKNKTGEISRKDESMRKENGGRNEESANKK